MMFNQSERKAKKQRKQKKRKIMTTEVDTFLFQDRYTTNPNVTRKHIKDMLALPLKKKGEKGLFHDLLNP